MNRMKMALVAGLALLASIAGALALNQDQTRNFPARLFATQQVHYYRVVVNFNDPNISTAQKFGALPSNAYIQDVQVEIQTAFNAGTTNNLSFGTTSTATELVAVADLTGGGGASIGTQVTRINRGLGRSLTASGDTTLFAKYTQTGSAATTGKAVFVITYIPDNDQ